jgi:hypothetical protein
VPAIARVVDDENLKPAIDIHSNFNVIVGASAKRLKP